MKNIRYNGKMHDTLPKKSIVPEHRHSQKGKDRFGKIHSQGEHVGFAECRYRLSGITGTVGTMETLN